MSFVPPFFKDLGKKASDLFRNDFDLGHQLKSKHTTPQGVGLETTIDGVVPQKASLKTTYKCKVYGKAEVNLDSAGAFKAKGTLDKLYKGLKVNLEGSAKGAKKATKVEGQFSQDFLAVSASVSGLGVADPTADASVSIGSDGLSVGVAGSLDKSCALANKNVGVEFVQGNFVAAVTTSNSMKTISASFYNKVSADYQFGVRFTDKEGASKNMELASQYELDADTTIKSKFTLPTNQLLLGVQHKLANPKLKFGLVQSYSFGEGQLKCDNFGVQVSMGEF